MKTIQLKRTTINIPECWDDLTVMQIPFVFRTLMLLLSNEITPFQFKLALLIEFTGYKQKKRSKLWFFFTSIRLVYLKTFKPDKFNRLLELQSECMENIDFNLVQLADQYNFAFSLEDNKITPNYFFKCNPISWFENSPEFYIDITVETNITAKQYIDCIDLINANYQSDDIKVKTHCCNKIMCILYDLSMKKVKSLVPEIPFAVMFWFTGIVKFFREHPVYSVLYDRENETETDDSKINLGMTEIMLYLEKEGYSFVQDKTVIEFYDAQIKALKDSVNDALSKEVKLNDLSQATGLSITNINRLSHG